jgi:hypothetical protein
MRAVLGKTKQIQKRISAESNIDAAEKRKWTSAINPFLCKSEGMRRLSIVLSTVSVLAWVTFAWVKSAGFKLIEPRGWVILFAAPFGAYLSVMALRLVALWLRAGFRNETHPNQLVAADPSSVTAPAADASSVTSAPRRKPSLLWYYLIGVWFVGAYASLLFGPDFARLTPAQKAGENGVWISVGFYFYLWWKRHGRKGWQGFLIGMVIGYFFMVLAFFLRAHMGATARAR